ncbi:MAG: hypothetical protein KDD66_01695 [Bdellovibrionales bacterium]|nr:hypothetical protein [Bdellovibrionales bacterium]
MYSCSITGRQYELSPLEARLREKFSVRRPPDLSPAMRIRHLGAFWHHWALHKRKCDATGRSIVSPFSESCPYPVVHRDYWLENANPPATDYTLEREIFPQLWELFQRSPIPHSSQGGNQNCEYADDWWYSKNCYLCHSGIHNEDLRHCYRAYYCKDSQYSVFSFYCELCSDTINCFRCSRVRFAVNCRDCSESAFLYDCRGCSECMFCSNLRNKKFCFNNEQLTQEEYRRKTADWDLRSREAFEEAKEFFYNEVLASAWHQALQNENTDNCSGNYLTNCKNCEDCFFLIDCEDSFNCLRGGPNHRDSMDCIGFALETELIYHSTMIVDHCYDVKFSYHLTQCRFMEYCAFCMQCEHCFGCCGLLGKKYHIFNKEYSAQEYHERVAELKRCMQQTDEYERFFPGYFAQTPYEETWSNFYFPLNAKELAQAGFRPAEERAERKKSYLDAAQVPDHSGGASTALLNEIYWDTIVSRPFRIEERDIAYSSKLASPLPDKYYMRRLQENFRLVFFEGELRSARCAETGAELKTTLPEEFDSGLLCEAAYERVIY